MLGCRGEVGTNEMPYLQLGVSFWQVHLRRQQVEAAWSFSASPKKSGGENGYLNPHEIYKFTNSQKPNTYLGSFVKLEKIFAENFFRYNLHSSLL
jgi:hypothetical protein